MMGRNILIRSLRVHFAGQMRGFAQASRLPKDGLGLSDFLQEKKEKEMSDSGSTPPTSPTLPTPNGANFHIKTYGCQMNVSDSDIVRSLLLQNGLNEVQNEEEADVLLTNTCAIRENAEQKVWHRLRDIKSRKRDRIVGVLGCMAERLKEGLLNDGLVDVVVGPDAYRDLPKLIHDLLQQDVDTAVNVQLSLEETYADITPVRKNPNEVSAFISVMRGCNNMCSYCVVPFTRGRERSRPFQSIMAETQNLLDQGVKEIVLLGQNVNSYHDRTHAAAQALPQSDYTTSNEGFSNLYRLRGGAGYYFADLVEAISTLDPELRIRFTSPHPKDYPPPLLQLMAERPNVCKQLHMPAQSGSTSVLKRMRRGYSREAYLRLIHDVKSTIPDVALSSDFIAGFCGETEEEHLETISLMEQISFDQAYMFAYSMRGKTHAHRAMADDVSDEIKLRRLQEIIAVFRNKVQERNNLVEVGRLRLVLLEGQSKRSTPENPSWSGRTDQNKRVIFPMIDVLDHDQIKVLVAKNDPRSILAGPKVSARAGDYVVVEIVEARGHTLRGRMLWRTSLTAYNEMNLSLAGEKTIIESIPSASRHN